MCISRPVLCDEHKNNRQAEQTLSPPPSLPLHRHVPIVYTSEVSWQQELWRLLPTILLIGG